MLYIIVAMMTNLNALLFKECEALSLKIYSREIKFQATCL